MVLKLKTATDGKAEALPPIPYRGGKPLQQADGTRPRSIDLKEVLPLEKLTDVIGGKLDLRPGMILEYAFEADPQITERLRHVRATTPGRLCGTVS